MASNQTTNYQLHLWEPGDDFLREEFNENNERVDEALAGLAARTTYVPLLEVTTAAQADQVDVDVSGIDFTAWREVLLTYEQTSDLWSKLSLLVNGRTDAVYSDRNLTTRGYLLDLSRLRSGHNNLRITFNIPYFRDFIFCSYEMVIGTSSGSLSSYKISTGSACSPVLHWGELETLNFVGTVPAGTKIALWGVK